jgi:hypothetical protein
MKLDEIFDSEIPGLLQPVSWGWQGQFGWGDEAYIVELFKTDIRDVESKNQYEGTFYASAIEGDAAFSTSIVDRAPHNEPPTPVYGVVINAFVERWTTEAIDAICFSAEKRHATDKDQHDTKVRQYNTMARAAQRRGGGYLYVHRGIANEWLLSKEPVDSKYWTNILKEGMNELLDAGYTMRKI